VWTGEDSPTLATGRKAPGLHLQESPAHRPRFRAEHFQPGPSGTADEATVNGLCRAIVALDDSVRPALRGHVLEAALVDPDKITVPTSSCVANGTGCGIDDLLEFFRRLAQSGQAVHGDGRHLARELPYRKNYLMVYHILHSFFSQPEPSTGADPCAPSPLFASPCCLPPPRRRNLSKPAGAHRVPFLPAARPTCRGRIVAQKLSETLGSSSSSKTRRGRRHDRLRLRRKSKPDGYTLLLTASPFVIAPHVYKNMPYDALGDFAPVIRIASGRTCWSCIPRSA